MPTPMATYTCQVTNALATSLLSRWVTALVSTDRTPKARPAADPRNMALVGPWRVDPMPTQSAATTPTGTRLSIHWIVGGFWTPEPGLADSRKIEMPHTTAA